MLLVLTVDVISVMIYLMNNGAEAKIRKLSQNQAKALKAIVSFPVNKGSVVPGAYVSNASGLSANALGGTVSALARNNFIQPLGRNSRQFNWELVDPDLIQAKKDNSKELLNLIDKIAK